MSWLQDIGIVGGAGAGLALLVAVAAWHPASTSNNSSSPPLRDDSLSASYGTMAAPPPGAGNPPTADPSWAHGIASQIGARLTVNIPVPNPTPSVLPSPKPDVQPQSVVVTPPPVPTAVPAAPTPVANAGPSILGTSVPEGVRRWEPYIVKYSAQYQLDPNLVAAVMMTESAGNPLATSKKGAVGLMQVMGGTYDPEQNVAAGTRILAADLQKFGGDVELSLAAYNAGAGAVDRYAGIPPYLETETYVYLVLNRYYLYSPVG